MRKLVSKALKERKELVTWTWVGWWRWKDIPAYKYEITKRGNYSLRKTERAEHGKKKGTVIRGK